jgi:exosome complex RNA-binding protein Rrp4
MAFKGTHDVQSRGRRVWRQRLKVSPFQKIRSGTILVANSKNLMPGANTYKRKHNIHAKIDGMVEIKNRFISVTPFPVKENK